MCRVSLPLKLHAGELNHDFTATQQRLYGLWSKGRLNWQDRQIMRQRSVSSSCSYRIQLASEAVPLFQESLWNEHAPAEVGVKEKKPG